MANLHTTSEEAAVNGIANKDAKIAFDVYFNGRWFNIADTLMRTDMNDNLHLVNDQVENQEKEIMAAEENIEQVHSQAESAINASSTAVAATSEMSTATSEAKAAADSAVANVSAVQSDVSKALSDADTALSTAASVQSSAASAISNAKTALSSAASASTLAADAASAASANKLEIVKNSSAIALKANSTDLDALSKRVASNATSIDQNSKEIVLKANQTDFDNLNKTVTSNSTQIAQTAKTISMKADESTVDTLKDTVDNHSTQISQNSKDIALKADQTTVDSLGQTVSSQGTQITQNANGIATKAEQSAVDALNKTVSSQGTQLSQTAQAIATKADSKDVDSLKKTVDTNSTLLTQTSKEIAAKVDQTTVDSLAGKISKNTSDITANSKAILSKVTSDDVAGILKDGKYTNQDYVQSKIKQTADEINQSIANTNGQVSNLNQTVTGLSADVKDKASQSKVTELSNLINSKVSSGDFQTEITQLTNSINERVTKGKLISQINQEAGGNTLIEVSNGTGKLQLDAATVAFAGKAFIPSAAITDITADQIKTGILSGNDLAMNLNTGEIKFSKGSIGSIDGKFNFNITDGKIELTNKVAGFGETIDPEHGFSFTHNGNSYAYFFGGPLSGHNRNLIPHSTTEVQNSDGTMRNVYTVSSSQDVYGELGVGQIYILYALVSAENLPANTTGMQLNVYVSDGNGKQASIGPLNLYTLASTAKNKGMLKFEVPSSIVNSKQNTGYHLILSPVDGTTQATVDRISLYNQNEMPQTPFDKRSDADSNSFDLYWDHNVQDDEALDGVWIDTPDLNLSGGPNAVIHLGKDTDGVEGILSAYASDISFDSLGSLSFSVGATLDPATGGVRSGGSMVAFEQGSQLPPAFNPNGMYTNAIRALNSQPLWFSNDIYSDGGIDASRLVIFNGATTHGTFDWQRGYVTYTNGDAKGFWIKGTDLWVDNTVYGKAWSQTSVLSAKTNINKLDQQHALDVINATDIYDYQYKSDVEKNVDKHYASLVIDDIHNTPEYRTPREFIGDKGTGRDDGTQLAYLTAAVQLIDQRLKKLEDKNGRK